MHCRVHITRAFRTAALLRSTHTVAADGASFQRILRQLQYDGPIDIGAIEAAVACCHCVEDYDSLMTTYAHLLKSGAVSSRPVVLRLMDSAHRFRDLQGAANLLENAHGQDTRVLVEAGRRLLSLVRSLSELKQVYGILAPMWELPSLPVDLTPMDIHRLMLMAVDSGNTNVMIELANEWPDHTIELLQLLVAQSTDAHNQALGRRARTSRDGLQLLGSIMQSVLSTPRFTYTPEARPDNSAAAVTPACPGVPVSVDVRGGTRVSLPTLYAMHHLTTTHSHHRVEEGTQATPAGLGGGMEGALMTRSLELALYQHWEGGGDAATPQPEAIEALLGQIRTQSDALLSPPAQPVTIAATNERNVLRACLLASRCALAPPGSLNAAEWLDRATRHAHRLHQAGFPLGPEAITAYLMAMAVWGDRDTRSQASKVYAYERRLHRHRRYHEDILRDVQVGVAEHMDHAALVDAVHREGAHPGGAPCSWAWDGEVLAWLALQGAEEGEVDWRAVVADMRGTPEPPVELHCPLAVGASSFMPHARGPRAQAILPGTAAPVSPPPGAGDSTSTGEDNAGLPSSQYPHAALRDVWSVGTGAASRRRIPGYFTDPFVSPLSMAYRTANDLPAAAPLPLSDQGFDGQAAIPLASQDLAPEVTSSPKHQRRPPAYLRHVCPASPFNDALLIVLAQSTAIDIASTRPRPFPPPALPTLPDALALAPWPLLAETFCADLRQADQSFEASGHLILEQFHPTVLVPSSVPTLLPDLQTPIACVLQCLAQSKRRAHRELACDVFKHLMRVLYGATSGGQGSSEQHSMASDGDARGVAAHVTDDRSISAQAGGAAESALGQSKWGTMLDRLWFPDAVQVRAVLRCAVRTRDEQAVQLCLHAVDEWKLSLGPEMRLQAAHALAQGMRVMSQDGGAADRAAAIWRVLCPLLDALGDEGVMPVTAHTEAAAEAVLRFLVSHHSHKQSEVKAGNGQVAMGPSALPVNAHAQWFEYMTQAGIRPSPNAYQAMLTAHRADGNLRGMLQTLQHAIERDVCLPPPAIAHAIRTLAASVSVATTTTTSAPALCPDGIAPGLEIPRSTAGPAPPVWCHMEQAVARATEAPMPQQPTRSGSEGWMFETQRLMVTDGMTVTAADWVEACEQDMAAILHSHWGDASGRDEHGGIGADGSVAGGMTTEVLNSVLLFMSAKGAVGSMLNVYRQFPRHELQPDEESFDIVLHALTRYVPDAGVETQGAPTQDFALALPRIQDSLRMVKDMRAIALPITECQAQMLAQACLRFRQGHALRQLMQLMRHEPTPLLPF